MRRLFIGLLLLAGWLAQAGAAVPALLLQTGQPRVAAWPAVRLLADPGASLDMAQALARLHQFTPPDGPTANLGPRRGAVWLYLPLRAVDGDGRWVLDIDYPTLNSVELVLLRDGEAVAMHRLGAAVPFEQRPLHSRSHAVVLDLKPGVAHAVLMRVVSDTAMILPISLSTADAFHRAEADAQLLQGLLAGIALALVAYSLAHWLNLRDAVFLEYASMLVGVSTFFLFYFGIGQQYLAGAHAGLLVKAAPLGVLLALAGGSLFVASALRTRSLAPWAHRGLLAVAGTATTLLLASLAGLLDYRATQVAATLMGPLPMLIAVPEAFRQVRAGDRLAFFMLLGWSAYMVGALAMVALLRGHLSVDFWTMHLFQFTSLTEMLLWTQVLSLRIEGIRRGAERLVLEKSALESLAHTDALTGLPNRRGLQQALTGALAGCHTDQVLAVYLLDLDGFKPVNDRHGHDVGDALLVQVGQRLRQQLRHSDVVARLGGDEFVIMAGGLAGEDEALQLGRKLLDAFGQPFELDGVVCRVGLTIGFALAPHDGRDAGDLLKRADAAMYAGKQAGRHTIRRDAASAGLAGA